MSKFQVDINDRKVLILIGAVIAGLFFFAVIVPRYQRARAISGEAKALESELELVHRAMDNGRSISRKAQFLTKNQISLAIDEIAKVGNEMDISFLSTGPEEIQKPKGSDHPVLPIKMKIQSDYKDLGRFFGALENLKRSVVTIRSFAVRREQSALPQVVTEVVLDVHLKGS